jgi:hypothetical protein
MNRRALSEALDRLKKIDTFVKSGESAWFSRDSGGLKAKGGTIDKRWSLQCTEVL